MRSETKKLLDQFNSSRLNIKFVIEFDFRGGIALIINRHIGLYIKNNKFFAVNGFAKNVWKELEYSHESINFIDLYRIAKHKSEMSYTTDTYYEYLGKYDVLNNKVVRL